MWLVRMRVCGCGLNDFVMVMWGLTATTILAQAPDPLQVAKEAVNKMAEEEKAAHTEWNSVEMARSATREICVSARATVERAEQAKKAAEELLQQKVEAAKAAREALAAEQDADKKKVLQEAVAQADAEEAAARQRVAERQTTLQSAADRMLTDQGVGDRAAEKLLGVEDKLGQRMQATRVAERAVLALEAEAAAAAAASALAEKDRLAASLTYIAAVCRFAADQAAAEKDANRKAIAQQVADKIAADKAAAEKSFAEKNAAAEAAAKQAQAALLAQHEHDVIIAWEAREWLGVNTDTLNQMLGGDDHAAAIATRLAATEPDAERKKKLQDFAAEMTARRDATTKTRDEKVALMSAADPKIHALRIAAAGGLTPLAPERWDYAKARHLLVRAGFGGTPEEVAKLHALGLYGAVDYLVDFHRQPAASVPFDAAPPTQPDPLENKLKNDFIRGRVAGARAGVDNSQLPRLRQWWLKRMVQSPRPLQEKLTLFWHGHFATQNSVVGNSFTFYHQNQLFREHAAANFGGLLYGIVHDPVMLRYLDNNRNVKGQPNENLAREIMELFAMGVDQGYTQNDIKEAARALTGYTYDHFTGQFRFIAAQHDEGPKTIFGKSGAWTGDDLVGLILDQPSTARFISGKLFAYFAHDNPAPEVVDRLAHVLRSNQYELAPMLKNLFLSEEFYSDRSLGTQIKSPVQLVVGMLRDLGVKELANPGELDGAISNMGQQLLEPPDVKGWREGRSWMNTNRLFLRYNTVSDLVKGVTQSNNRRGVDVVALLNDKQGYQTSAEVVDFLAKTCLVRPLGEQKRKELIDYMQGLPPSNEWADKRDLVNEKLTGLLVLMLSIPEYQLT